MKIKKKHVLDNEKGFTVIELLVVLSVIGIVIGSLGQFFVTQLRSYNEQQDRLTIHEQALKASDALSMLLMPCDEITEIEKPNIDEKPGPVTSITLHIPEYNKANSAQTVVPESTVRLDLINGELVKIQTPDNKILATNIDSIEMWPYAPELIVTPKYTSSTNNAFMNIDSIKTTGIKIVLHMKAGKNTSNFTQEIFFRNKP
jgi:prepilin-type N-terminal cleavage/methylation domain-containing protein